ncbi:hypothetical protein IJ707_04595 [bacterium]|nr:hypothetical protein [bacterium]
MSGCFTFADMVTTGMGVDVGVKKLLNSGKCEDLSNAQNFINVVNTNIAGVVQITQDVVAYETELENNIEQFNEEFEEKQDSIKELECKIQDLKAKKENGSITEEENIELNNLVGKYSDAVEDAGIFKKEGQQDLFSKRDNAVKNIEVVTKIESSISNVACEYGKMLVDNNQVSGSMYKKLTGESGLKKEISNAGKQVFASGVLLNAGTVQLNKATDKLSQQTN